MVSCPAVPGLSSPEITPKRLPSLLFLLIYSKIIPAQKYNALEYVDTEKHVPIVSLFCIVAMQNQQHFLLNRRLRVPLPNGIQ